ncbi:hypothetical protein J3R30DRAFT_217713 [Lentinula aciculospora]|uniref:Cyclin N-terminal domain-containing protein n=1 Tax=Lentinula aciculospora TaxID=153920 RepID=A0A9W9AA05_9AGAR|nr:hypothetical protein J3R30DRAFT_217713 [Lentinula aciculospora]
MSSITISNRASSPSVYSDNAFSSSSISISSTRYSAAPSFCAPEDGLAQLEAYAPSEEIVAYVVQFIADVIEHASNVPHNSKDKRRSTHRLINFTKFVTKVVTRLQLATPELLLIVAYVDRAQYRRNMNISTDHADEHALEGVFLGALALALQYLHKQISIKDIDWHSCTGSFSFTDISRFEIDFIQIIKCNDRFTDKELSAYSAVMLAVLQSAPNHFLKHHASSYSSSKTLLRRCLRFFRHSRPKLNRVSSQV